ncbi:ribosome biogenesis GTP-binding protein YlqF [Ruminiclostridium papyrosolvens DSM 2782]|uniref:Ribosome biogenesis GTPase A n=1 Tax=Ruminiclostridium papyrosolvens DSM 2782 TaxID=588581 RepID=F1TI90_9FIRM|nr:ribosome biogenesis GTPase YlqF [Ruminiclostridium papyrosolvens]EGD45868.1 ribosome biogenesis GTP-binding protein YlqF [Ruminiclostridium papyrosolvens DSM 2782]WES36349.1 ribosome biogenesis GTPase YlqF [Ruminiclostridium papyrosolvens DSM 2782]
MNIQWFPGHMAKTRRLIAENLKLVDVIIELLDARIPFSSRNPEINSLINNKPRLIAFNKSDLADDRISRQWIKWYAEQGIDCILINSINGKGLNEIKARARELMSEKIERNKAKGKLFTPVRTMVVGIPNVGKSSFINKIVGRATAVTGDRPGVTRGKQWIRINSEIELLDTPGILWPKFEDQEVGMNLAFTGAIKDDIMDTGEVAMELLHRLSKTYNTELCTRFKLEPETIKDMKPLELLETVGRKRGCIVSKGEIDYSRISAIVLDEFRGGKIGRVTLEKPGDRAETKTE